MASANNYIHVLLVEDDDVDVMSIQREFKKFNLPVYLNIAKNGCEALEMLYGINNHKKLLPLPQLIILDIMMPKMDGIQFLENLRSDHQFDSIKIIIFTTSSNEADKKAVRDFNVSGFFVKNTQFNDFFTTCRTLMQDY